MTLQSVATTSVAPVITLPLLFLALQNLCCACLSRGGMRYPRRTEPSSCLAPAHLSKWPPAPSHTTRSGDDSDTEISPLIRIRIGRVAVAFGFAFAKMGKMRTSVMMHSAINGGLPARVAPTTFNSQVEGPRCGRLNKAHATTTLWGRSSHTGLGSKAKPEASNTCTTCRYR